jgi:hypothetical protein
MAGCMEPGPKMSMNEDIAQGKEINNKCYKNISRA